VSFRVLHLTFDCADPGGLADFWCASLGYRRSELGNEHVAEAVPPDGVQAPKLLFIKVPEPKTAKNRVHLDVNVGAGLPHDGRKSAVRTRADEIVALGATELRTAEENGEYWIVMQDIDGNEFCVQ
jgi:hypothetical protein